MLFTCSEPDLTWLESIPEVDAVNRRSDAVEVVGRRPVLPLVAHALVGRGIVPPDLRAERPTLEDAFLALTGRQIRD